MEAVGMSVTVPIITLCHDTYLRVEVDLIFFKQLCTNNRKVSACATPHRLTQCQTCNAPHTKEFLKCLGLGLGRVKDPIRPEMSCQLSAADLQISNYYERATTHCRGSMTSSESSSMLVIRLGIVDVC